MFQGLNKINLIPFHISKIVFTTEIVVALTQAYCIKNGLCRFSETWKELFFIF